MSNDLDPAASSFGDTSKPKRGILSTVIKVFTVLGIAAILVGLMLPAVRTAGPAARRSQCKNNLKQIGLALHNYAEANGGVFPPAYTVDAEGKPLHSWRTLILPYCDQAPLYNRIDLSKAWNDPANAEAFNTRIQTYQCPETKSPSNLTTYLGVVGTGAFFHPTQPRRWAEITDGNSETLMVVEVELARAVPWMAPTDTDGALAQVLGQAPHAKHPHSGGARVLFADGVVRFLSAKTQPETRRALISINGKETVGEF